MNDIVNELNDMFEAALNGADYQSIGQKLQLKRITLNLKLVDIARITGLSESLIGKIESDKVNDIKISTMKKLSMAYDLPPDVFINLMGLDDSLSQMSQKLTEIAQARLLLRKG